MHDLVPLLLPIPPHPDMPEEGEMSEQPKHAKPTLVRLFEGGNRVANILVNYWEERDGRARFAIPATHPRGRWLMNSAIGTEVSILVLDSDDIEWMIQTVYKDGALPFYEITLVSRRRRITESQPNDDYCIRIFGVRARPCPRPRRRRLVSFWRRKRHCAHSNLRGIYGDQINHCGGFRLWCADCRRHLDGPVALAEMRRPELEK